MDKPLLPTQPESYWQLIRRSLRLYKISFKKVMLLSLLLSVTAFIPRLLSFIIGQDIIINLSLFSINQLWLAIINLVGYIFFIGIIWHMHCEVIHKHEPLREDIGMGLKKAINVFIAATLQGLFIIAFAALIISTQILLHIYQPWLFEGAVSLWLLGILFACEFALLAYISTLFIFIVPIIAIENLGIIAALKRSALLVWNHWWRTITVQATPWIGFILLLSFERFILNINIHIYFTAQQTHSLLITLFHIIIFALFVPWVAATLLVQLQDLELRKKLIT